MPVLTVCSFFILRHIKKMEAKSSSQMRYFFRFFYAMLANCVHANIGNFVHVWTRNYFFTKFAAECDWNRENSQNVQNLGFFWKNRYVFSKKILNFSKIATCGNFFLECVSNGICSWKCLSTLFLRFFGKNQKKIKVGKVRKSDEETE